jgi:hypothetical protein
MKKTRRSTSTGTRSSKGGRHAVIEQEGPGAWTQVSHDTWRTWECLRQVKLIQSDPPETESSRRGTSPEGTEEVIKLHSNKAAPRS